MEHIKSQSQGLVTTDRDHGHEETDINVKAIIGFLVVLALFAVLTHVALWGMYIYLDRVAEKRNEGVTTPIQEQVEAARRPQVPERKSAQGGQLGIRRAETARDTLDRLQAVFPTPRLQDDAVRDLNMMRNAEDKLLNHYSWIDKNSGAVRIPVSRAIVVLAERGLPTVPGETPAKAGTRPAAAPAPRQ